MDGKKIFTSVLDVNGIRLKSGDIVAEGKVGVSIWDGTAVVLRRPLGVVEIGETRDNLIPIRTGSVLYTDDEDGGRIQKLYLSRHDGWFTAWDNVEKVGSVDTLPD